MKHKVHLLPDEFQSCPHGQATPMRLPTPCPSVRTSSLKNLHAAGVVDPAKVTRVALENAASIAGMFLTTECVIVEKKEDKPEMPMGAPGMGGMGGMM